MSAFFRVFWLCAVLALMVAGASKLGKPPTALPLVDRSRDSSINTVLEQTLGEAHVAGAITDWLAKLPEGKEILVLSPPDNMGAAITADAISYLAWPRPVVMSAKPEEMRALMSTRDRFAAVGLCYMQAPPG